jgi:hypothetical protein
MFDSGLPRIKPDLVVDVAVTSNATALASGAGALLRSEANARKMPAGELAIKAIMMAGAHRDSSWHRGRASGSDNLTSPLDYQQGAGQLRVDNAFDILQSGRRTAGTKAPADAGWDSARTGRTKRTATYYLHVGEELEDWAAVLTWNRVIAGAQDDGTYSTRATLADMDLSLYRSTRGGRRLVARSDSPNDNVETLILTDLPAGDYQLELTTDVRAYYALAWYADEGGGFGLPKTALAPMASGAGTGASSAGGLIATLVPEPSCLGLAGMSAVSLLGRRRRRLVA